MEAIINRELIVDKKLCRLFGVGVFIIFTTLSAFVRIPLPYTPVPLTLQTFFVLLSGALLGKKLGVISQAAYMFLGLTGQQVFTGLGSGSLYLLGPTGGYLVGFVLASFFVGSFLSVEKQSMATVFIKLLAADFIILFSGTLWLRISMFIPLHKAFLLGFLPFVLGDILKVSLATVVYNKLRARVKSALY
ncbi:MAG: biotin transporter BioY [Candidatus Omnitrophica bacterium]|nr:biotin transporter BioY [Candidatus Omnitrophota bacterium]